MLDPAPRGDTTEEETRLAKPVMTDARLQFGAMGAWQTNNGPIEFGFTFPGTSDSRGRAVAERLRDRRYDPTLSPD